MSASNNNLRLMNMLFGYFSLWQDRPAILVTPVTAEHASVNSRIIIQAEGDIERSECSETNCLGFTLSLYFRPVGDSDYLSISDKFASIYDYIRNNPISLYAAETGYSLRFAGIDCRGNIKCERLSSGYHRMVLALRLVWVEHSSTGKPFIRLVSRSCSVLEGIDFSLIGYEGLEAPESFISSNLPVGGERRIVGSAFADSRCIKLKLCVEEFFRESFIMHFAPSEKGILYATRNNSTRYIPYIVQKAEYSLDTDIGNGGIFFLTLTLFCPDPYFMCEVNSVYTVHRTVPLLTFPFNSYSGAGITASVIRSDMNINVFNSGHAYAGVRIKLTADSAVVNPSVSCGSSQIELDRTMSSTDTIEICTLPGAQGVWVNGTKSMCFTRSSDFFTLPVGSSTLAFDADSDVSSLNASVTVVERYYGV